MHELIAMLRDLGCAYCEGELGDEFVIDAEARGVCEFCADTHGVEGTETTDLPRVPVG